MINRAQSPKLSGLSVPSILPYSRRRLENGTELIVTHDGNQEIFKLDVIFDAGAYYQPSPLVASTTLNLLNEGTRFHNAEELADTFDYHGAYIDFNCGMHTSEISLISLNKYCDRTIGTLAEMVQESIFPEKELEIFLRNKRQQFLVDLEKTPYLARKEFSACLFGATHPYANPIAESDYREVQRETISHFYDARFRHGVSRILLSGNISEQVIAETEKQFGQSAYIKHEEPTTIPAFEGALPDRYHVYKADAVQSSIRIGRAGVHVTHPDYAGFQLLNTVLGGYFGSRLMSNIREDKGYTYGINSFNVSLPLASYWCIATDVNTDHTEATIDEVLKEIKRLQTERVPEEELSLVKNYVHGELLRELDGAFSQSDALKHKINYNMDNTFYIDLIQRIQHVTPATLQELAKRYWDADSLYIVTAGEKR